MRYFYIVIIAEENGKYYSFCTRVSESDNLVHNIHQEKTYAANICGSRKRAYEIVEAHNRSFKENGTYLFDELLF